MTTIAWTRAGILSAVAGAFLLHGPAEGWAIQVHPTPAQVDAALEEGRAAARAKLPPDRLYAWFGPTDALAPYGFLMTKLAGIRVMAAHFALRAATPTREDIDRILESDTLLISVVIFGDRPDFAVDSYLALVQGDRTIPATQVRFDGTASRSAAWPASPAYRAKVVASIPYDDFDPMAVTRIAVFPGSGGEVSFTVELARIE